MKWILKSFQLLFSTTALGTIWRLVVYTIVTIAIGALAMTNITDVIFQFGIVTALLLVLTLNLSRWIFEPWPMLRFRERAVR